MIWRLLSILGASSVVFACSGGDARSQSFLDDGPKVRIVPSQYRDGVDVEFLYNQYIGGVYSTTWLGRLEKQDGLWRDVYFETAEKYNAKGIMSFQCFADGSGGETDIGIIEYGWGAFGDPNSRHFATIKFEQRWKWAEEGLDSLVGESPPYELFVVAHYRYCGDEWELNNIK